MQCEIHVHITVRSLCVHFHTILYVKAQQLYVSYFSIEKRHITNMVVELNQNNFIKI